MNYKLFDKRLQSFLGQFSSNEQKISALREVIRQSPQGQSYRRSLCKGFPNDTATNEAIADVCNLEIIRLSGFKQLTIFDAIAVLRGMS